MRRCIPLFILALAIAACSGDTTGPKPPTGPLALAIVAGQNQTATAGSDSLSKPVVGQLVVAANGRLVFRTIGGVHAQTVVEGSPVAGAVVCAVSVDSMHPLIPFTPCTNTDSNGQATFFFAPSTRAGAASAEIRGTVQDAPAVFDTAVATVLPSRPDTIALRVHAAAVFIGQTVSVDSIVDHIADRYGNRIAPDSAGFTASPSLGDPIAAGFTRFTFAAGSVSDTVSVAGLPDIRLHGWTATYSCTGPRLPGTQPDSAQFTLQADSIVYGATPPMYGVQNGTFWAYFSGTETDWQAGASTQSPVTHAEFAIELADHLEWGGGHGSAVPNADFTTYTGGNWCPTTFKSGGAAVTFTAH